MLPRSKAAGKVCVRQLKFLAALSTSAHESTASIDLGLQRNFSESVNSQTGNMGIRGSTAYVLQRFSSSLRLAFSFS